MTARGVLPIVYPVNCMCCPGPGWGGQGYPCPGAGQGLPCPGLGGPPERT